MVALASQLEELVHVLGFLAVASCVSIGAFYIQLNVELLALSFTRVHVLDPYTLAPRVIQAFLVDEFLEKIARDVVEAK